MDAAGGGYIIGGNPEKFVRCDRLVPALPAAGPDWSSCATLWRLDVLAVQRWEWKWRRHSAPADLISSRADLIRLDYSGDRTPNA
jgi:hypothetical protein